MKLLTLSLSAVGPFTGVVLDLSAGEEGLHLIYGANEAGKSSALRAVSHLLFGFPHLSTDNFIHANDQLRVGGTLRLNSGDELALIRRRGNKNTLRGPDDASVIPDDRYRQFLGDIGRQSFETLFGINHERLRRAGDEIRQGEGELGELLFAAGAGLAGLRRAQKTLQQELDGLFRPRAQKNAQINKVLAEIDENQKRLKQQQLPSETWLDHDRAYREATIDSDRLREQIRAGRAEQAGLKRLRAATPHVARYRRLSRELAELKDVIRLREGFGAELREAQDQALRARNTIDEARLAIADLDGRLGSLDPSELLLDSADEIKSLQERLGANEKANQDRVHLTNSHSEQEHRARQILRELGRSPDLDQAESLRLRADEALVIRAMGQRSAALRGQAEQARRTIARHVDQIARLENELATLESPRDVELLRRVIGQARKAGDVDAWLTEAQTALSLAEGRGALALAQLPGWDQPIENLCRLAVPLTATVDLFDTRFQETARRRQALAERASAESELIRECQANLQSLKLKQDVPTEEAVAASREHRDEGWRLIKARWIDNVPDDKAMASFLAASAPTSSLVAAYEESVQRADMLADRLRREAERVAHNAALVAALEKHRASHAALEHELHAADELQAFIERDWNRLIAPLGISGEVLTPRELRAWLRAREEVVQLFESVADARRNVATHEESLAQHTRTIRQALESCRLSVTTVTDDLAELLEQTETLIKQHDDLVSRSSQLQSKLTNAKDEQANARLALQTAESELEVWHRDWSVKMSRIGLEADAIPDQAETILTEIGELIGVLDELGGLERRISGIDQDAQQFAHDVGVLAQRVAADIASWPPAEQARELSTRLRRAQDAARQSEALKQQRQREDINLKAATASLEEAHIYLERLRHEANCNNLAELADAERRSQNRNRVETELAAATEDLMKVAAGDDLGSFATLVEKADPDMLDASIAELETRIAVPEDELRGVEQKIGAARAALSQMNGSAQAAETAESIQALLAGLENDVTRFATLKIAADVLKRGIERYREKNQGLILARASDLFATMTNGSFTRLTIDDDDGRSVLKGIRPDGRLVGVDGMSDGSHDQLYLALRLASLESWLESHEPVPFIVDDILLTFDDARATAALGALAELSRKTQVLFFTHHRHLVELAQVQLPNDIVFVHELPRSGDPLARAASALRGSP
jgi:uncharacterized protein YhaN